MALYHRVMITNNTKIRYKNTIIAPGLEELHIRAFLNNEVAFVDNPPVLGLG